MVVLAWPGTPNVLCSQHPGLKDLGAFPSPAKAIRVESAGEEKMQGELASSIFFPVALGSPSLKHICI